MKTRHTRICAIACAVLGSASLVSLASGGDAPPKFYFEGTGTLSIGPQGCPGFLADEHEQLFVLENTGGFAPPDRVYVTGIIQPGTILCFPSTFPGIQANTVQLLFEGCGEIGFGPQGCLVLNTPDRTYFVDDAMGFEIGADVEVQAAIIEKSIVCFPVLGDSVQVLDIASCKATDLTNDGFTDSADLLTLLGTWGPCDACPADFNTDGEVDLLDLLDLLNDWG